jgi:hypothetical protein
MAITIICNTGFFFLGLLQCSPVQYSWAGWLGEDGETIDRGFAELASYVFAGVGAATDWALVLICPLFFWDSDLGGRAKFFLRLLMVIGIWFVTLDLHIFV